MKIKFSRQGSMCGEIEDWQEAHTLTIRLTSNAAKNTVKINAILAQCEEIRLDEIFLKNFNGGASTAFYLNFEISGMSSGFASNENKSGLLLAYDPSNPQQFYSRPKVLSKGMTNLSGFSFSVLLPDGSVPSFDEAAFMMTVVCRRSADSLAEVRRLRQQMSLDRPNLRDGVVANSFRN